MTHLTKQMKDLKRKYRDDIDYLKREVANKAEKAHLIENQKEFFQ